jgi:hypothetical protein
MQMYDGGQPCDITGAPRSTEVRFVCGEGGKDAVSGITEAATCRYVLTFSTPRLCAHPGFQAPEPPVHHILCALADAAEAGSAVEQDDASAEGAAAQEGAAEAEAGVVEGDDAKGVQQEGAESAEEKVLRAELGQVLEDIARGVNVNVSALEAALANTEAGEGTMELTVGEGTPHLGGGGAEQEGTRGEASAEVGQDPAEVADGDGVGPPAAQEEEVADEGEEEEEEDLHHGGMHAEL